MDNTGNLDPSSALLRAENLIDTPIDLKYSARSSTNGFKGAKFDAERLGEIEVHCTKNRIDFLPCRPMFNIGFRE